MQVRLFNRTLPVLSIRIMIPVMLTIILFVLATQLIAIPAIEKSILESRKLMMRELTYVVWEVLDDYNNRVESGELELEQAQESAKDRIRAMRYGKDNKDYFYISSVDTYLVMHPYRPDLENIRRSEADSGTEVILHLSFLQAASDSGEGFNTYQWQLRDETSKVQDKLSYVKNFAPWGWQVGTGFYLDEVNHEVEKVVARLNRAFLLILLVILILSFLIIYRAYKVESCQQKIMAELKDSQIRSMLAQQAASFGIWDWSIEKDYLTCSEQLRVLLGIDTTSCDHRLSSLLERVHPADRDRFSRTMETAIAENETLSIEVRMYRANGNDFWVQIVGRLVRNEAQEPERFLAITIDIDNLKRKDKQIVRSEEKYRSLYENMLDAMYIRSAEGEILDCNQAMADLFLVNKEDLIGTQITDLYVDKREHDEFEEKLLTFGFTRDFPEVLKRKDGRKIYVLVSTSIFRDDEGHMFFQGTIRDVTEHKALEDQLLQSQKIEAIGRVAGGVAHDFNNLLTIIISRCELNLLKLKEDHPLRSEFQEILETSERASELTRQLLAFSRRQATSPKTINISSRLLNMEKLLRRIIGEDILLHAEIEEGVWPIKIDPTQFEQIALNLIVNARDAMPNGGDIRISLSNICITDIDRAEYGHLNAGDYVIMRIEDSGLGMSEETMEHIFEPFFTTKREGQGTGLGLSTVYGIVKQAEAEIRVTSEEGKGTVFSIFFPRVNEIETSSEKETDKSERLAGKETILVVEDESYIRDVLEHSLKQYGYQVFPADNAEVALGILEDKSSLIDLVISDVVMPGMNGGELASIIREKYSRIRVLLMSGYTEDSMHLQSVLKQGIPFLPKPFGPETLLTNVRAVMDNSDSVEMIG